MAARMRIGDVFEVALGNGQVGYFQYVAVDMSQLQSAVIRAFARLYDEGNRQDLAAIVANKVSFHAHVLLKSGYTLKIWHKVGNAPAPTEIDVLFRNSGDYGNPEIKISKDWYVWRINEPFRHVGALTPEYQSAEIGVVKAPQEIAARMLTGRYKFVYPGY
jgi:Immunity protein 26